MALTRIRQTRNWKTMEKEDFSYIELVRKLQELKDYGFFYTREWFCEDETNGSNSVWMNHKVWLERVISKEWLQKPLEEISLEFEHFLSSEKKYLHMSCEKYGYREAKRTRLFVNSKQFIRNDSFMTENKGESCLAKILKDCDIYAESNEFRPISELGIRCRDESFLVAMCKNQYRQTKVIRKKYIENDCEYECWAGEFMQEMEKEKPEYLYLMHIRKYKPVYVECYGSRHISTQNYMLKSKERKIQVALPQNIDGKLQDMRWLNRPFTQYYDLPDEREDVEKIKVDYGQDALEYLLLTLKQDGYLYRREQLWKAVNEELLEKRYINQKEGFHSGYLEQKLSRILMEFVNDQTGECAYIDIESGKLQYYVCNGICGNNNMKLHTEYYRDDRSPLAVFYEDENLYTCEAEIIMPEPICLELLKKYNLIQEDQIKICYLAGQSEFQEWFELKHFIGGSLPSDEEGTELRPVQLERMARARRIARRLRYSLTEKCEIGGRTIEIYANKQGDRAIFIMDNGKEVDIRYADKYMNVNEALNGEPRNRLCIVEEWR